MPRRLIVWPRTFWLPPLGSAEGRPHCRGAVTDRRAGADGVRLGVRDHRTGDSLRDVHWAKTARYDRLIVSEREAATVEDAAVVVPIDPSAASGSRPDPTLEWRLRIAASVCESFATSHGHLELWLGGARVSASRGPGRLERLLDAVAQLRPEETTDAPATPHRGGVVITVGQSDGAIVLQRSRLGVPAGRSHSERTRWIEADPLGDVPEQVLRGWRLEARGSRAPRRPSRAG